MIIFRLNHLRSDGTDMHVSPTDDARCILCGYPGKHDKRPHREHPDGGWEFIDMQSLLTYRPPEFSTQKAYDLIAGLSKDTSR